MGHPVGDFGNVLIVIFLKFREEERPVVPTARVPERRWRNIGRTKRRRCSRAGGKWIVRRVKGVRRGMCVRTQRRSRNG